MKIYLTAVIKAKPEFLNEVKTMLKDMVVQTKNEKACIQYDLHQDTENENIFVFYEIWADQAGLDIHNEQPYIKNLGAAVPEKLQEAPMIFKMDKI